MLKKWREDCAAKAAAVRAPLPSVPVSNGMLPSSITVQKQEIKSVPRLNNIRPMVSEGSHPSVPLPWVPISTNSTLLPSPCDISLPPPTFTNEGHLQPLCIRIRLHLLPSHFVDRLLQKKSLEQEGVGQKGKTRNVSGKEPTNISNLLEKDERGSNVGKNEDVEHQKMSKLSQSIITEPQSHFKATENAFEDQDGISNHRMDTTCISYITPQQDTDSERATLSEESLASSLVISIPTRKITVNGQTTGDSPTSVLLPEERGATTTVYDYSPITPVSNPMDVEPIIGSNSEISFQDEDLGSKDNFDLEQSYLIEDTFDVDMTVHSEEPNPVCWKFGYHSDTGQLTGIHGYFDHTGKWRDWTTVIPSHNNRVNVLPYVYID